MNKLIDIILITMKPHLNSNQLSILQVTLNRELSQYDLKEKYTTNLVVVEDQWKVDLRDFLLEKQIEGKSIKTLRQYKGHLFKLFSSLNKNIEFISHKDICDYLNNYKMTHNISNRSLENKRLVFSSFFNWAYNHKRTSDNPILEGTKIKYNYTIKKPFTDEEMEQLSCNCTNERDVALIEFLYSSCVRVSELIGLNRNNIKLTEKELIVYGKGGKERITYINSRTYFHLQKYLNSRTDNNEALFVSNKKPHNRLTVAGIEAIVKRIGKRAGIPKVHPHRFRRTGATNALNRGMPVEEVSAFLGHKNISTTQLYCTVLQDNIKMSHNKYLSA